MVTFCSLCSFRPSFSLVFLSLFRNFVDAQAQDYYRTSAPISSQWTNNGVGDSISVIPGYPTSLAQPILLQGIGATGAVFGCGFFCFDHCNTSLFAVFIAHNYSVVSSGQYLIVNAYAVWSANRNNPVKIGAVLDLTSEGNLVLKDADGTVAWTTNTSGKSVVGLNLTDLGNLVLFDKNNMTVWQSFDEPTDSLVLGQKLMIGQKLTPSVSWTNWTVDGTISLSMNRGGLSAEIEATPPQIYYHYPIHNSNANNGSPYVQFVNGSLDFYSSIGYVGSLSSAAPASSAQFINLGSDGHLRVYILHYSYWHEPVDLNYMGAGACGYPIACGQYGICNNGQCSCPAPFGGMSYFTPVDDRQPNLGCSYNIPLSCRASQYQSFLEIEHVTYFAFTADLKNIDASSCKEACAKNCSCKAAMFQYVSDPTRGSCYLMNPVYSFVNIDSQSSTFITTAYLKVQNVPNQAPKDDKRSYRLPVILGSGLAVLFATMILIIIILLFARKRDDNEAEEDYLDQVPGMPSRFTYDDLKAITNDFSDKLGEGGFGSVFRGTLLDGTKVAVKRLDGFAQVKKSFLAEVETIGSVHHVNLVRLVGFCAEKFHRLLIYEYMPNKSLDRWIFHKSDECILNWQQRKKIILDIAKGLNYLHEDCRYKIAHLDIKPQNILLDGNFNAKVADFGLSKLIDKDQSQVVTTMRGTPGYLAPEWLSAAITEKVDVYSFGVVILEIICGRRIFDHSLDEEDMHLLSLFKRKAEDEQLLDIVDKCCEDMQLNGAQATNMMRIALWCLQGDYRKRPSMSMIIKVLEGILEVPHDLDYNFYAQPSTNGAAKFCQIYVQVSDTTPLLPSVLSGPR